MSDPSDSLAAFITPELERERARNEAATLAAIESDAASIRAASRNTRTAETRASGASRPHGWTTPPAHDSDDYTLFCTDPAARTREYWWRVHLEMERRVATNSRTRTWGLSDSEQRGIQLDVQADFMNALRHHLRMHPDITPAD